MKKINHVFITELDDGISPSYIYFLLGIDYILIILYYISPNPFFGNIISNINDGAPSPHAYTLI